MDRAGWTEESMCLQVGPRDYKWLGWKVWWTEGTRLTVSVGFPVHAWCVGVDLAGKIGYGMREACDFQNK